MKKVIFVCLSIGLLILVATGCSEQEQLPEWKRKYENTQTVRSMFMDPPMFYAPHAFWFWNDTIRDTHFPASMAQEMAKQRLNPGYAHPRSSMSRLNPKFPSLPYSQYLEDIWFDSFGNALNIAKEEGLTLGYCDEYDWPSGQAAGRVLKERPELEAKHLDWQRFEIAGGQTVRYDSIDFAVAAKLIDNKINSNTLELIGEGKNISWNVPEGNWVIYTYTKKHHRGYDGGKVNYLDPKLMEYFIPLVHEQYSERFGEEMGKSIPGVFVDHEGDYGWRMAWSEYLPIRYQEIKGRDMRLWLPLLTEKDNEGLYPKARVDWFEVISDVYEECFFTPMIDYLNEHEMYYISNLWEESLMFQAVAMGDFMRVTRKATMPGTDCLLMKSQDVHDFKEVQTISEFEDRPFMSEIMGVAGWVQTPEMMKMTINSITSFGVNHVVPHGINLNRRHETNPFPADWFNDNPFWPYLHNWTDFSRRASFVNRQSSLVADALLFNPQESVWANSEGIFSNDPNRHISDGAEDWDSLAIKVNQIYSDAMRTMNKNNIDFLIADNHYLQLGKVLDKKEQSKISVKNHEFSSIILPPVFVMSTVSMGKILEFAKAGGLVIVLGDLPKGSVENGIGDLKILNQNEELIKLPNVIDLSRSENTLNEMIEVLNKKVPPQIKIKNSGRLFTSHRKKDKDHFYWFANNSDSLQVFDAWLREGKGVAEIWDCETGKIRTIPSKEEQGYQKVSLQLKPYEAYWLVFNEEGKKFHQNTVTEDNSIKKTIPTEDWLVSYPMTDTIYRTSSLSELSLDINIDQKKLGLGFNDSDWSYKSFINKEPSEATAKSNQLEYWRITIPIGSKALIFPDEMNGWEVWLDGKKQLLSNNKTNLSKENRLLAFVATPNSKNLPKESLKFVVGKNSKTELKSWYTYGLEQYTGFMDYETTVTMESEWDKATIDLGDVKYVAEVFINDTSVGSRMWTPFNFNISNYLKKGKNQIRIRVGNLMVNEIWKFYDLGELRTWGWTGVPDYKDYDAGLFGPITLNVSN
ncbi:glycosyl hydrolase [Flagellimonas amoyensis]|uniref:glycosyl hydrolase n=1 Tax=Flagellimonas amoyensis TaxID=2169401 RepID=UPI000D34C30D|nr:glycosyl hydrolase [Allomuricauda amoyensis]